jgi:inner membrane transporter RhtA
VNISCRPADRLPPLWLAICAITCVQLGAAVSVPLFAVIGVAGTTWLRLCCAALALLIVVRPRGMSRDQLGAAGALGLVMAANSLLFAAATDRIPLGVAVAVEFCGPLGVAAFSGERVAGLARFCWPLVALAGVLVLTRPWSIAAGGSGGLDGLGVALAFGSALGWAGYILLTARVGRRSSGFGGLTVALVVAACCLAPFGAGAAWSAVDHGEWTALLRCALAAALVPLGAFALEMAALRRMKSAVFGVWMALEPGCAALAGLVLLAQPITIRQLPGFVLVVLAGVATQRAGHDPVEAEPASRRIGTQESAPAAL